jgi:hypothetical protein
LSFEFWVLGFELAARGRGLDIGITDAVLVLGESSLVLASTD